MLLDDSVRHAQAEAGPLTHLLRGEERLEDPRQGVARNAGTIVGHGDHDPGLALVHTHPGGDANGIAHPLAADAAAEDSLLGIQDQVEEHLLKLMGVAFGGGHTLAVGRADANARQHELRRAQAERLLDGLAHVDGAALGLPLPREEQQALHDLGHTATLRQHHLDGPAQVGGQVPRGEELRIAEDHGQRIVQLVRHTGDQLSHGGELPACRSCACVASSSRTRA